MDPGNRNRPIGQKTVSIGTADSAVVSPWELFKRAILNNAVGKVIVHNYPRADSCRDQSTCCRPQHA
ncbi:MAG: JAB domain-containing protein [Planctomycetota bacterium]